MSERAPRLPLLDAVRGIAIVAMVVYHGVWDLWSTGMVVFDPIHDRGSLWSRTAIIGTFLILVGMGVSLGTRNGIDPRRLVRRLIVLGAGALAVTVVSLILFPAAPILFGVLHLIFVSSLLALPLTRVHPLVAAGLGISLFALDAGFAFDELDSPLVSWIGLATQPPPSNDYVPIIPWFGMVAIGVAAGRWRRLIALLSAQRSLGRVGRLLSRMGRYSLLIYFGHQPILYGAVVGIAALTGPWEEPAARAFVSDCRLTCGTRSDDEAFCLAYCRCAAQNLLAPREPGADVTALMRRTARDCAERAGSR